ncbi:hypothetical protein NAEGRDRAFT_52938 [Naegleria gruberi]|uniref:Centrosomal protein 43 n=1 Tax=Naegleria gruberi TaxID=5762 RepID=D2VX36_NAEGR|nr:uncharacterized protein NAEGRDRAFT_52938 [Naegleria gruberi]EFC38614.1 hypothetical protein NAEGRDRAFT_52938 [Naegleria gruberi]|eukprot:XP_002671358.1 hypothetical protein NAEGRDRAFT_52938 [Naegleria gruberi strain NEG-M]
MSLEEIKDILKDNLEKRGVLNKIRANLRAEIFKTFEEQDHDETTEYWLKKQSSKPKPSDIQFLINELFIEYLEYNNMDYTKSVFLKECNQPQERLDKRFLAHELNIRKTYDEMDEDGDSVPLLYSIIHRLRNENVRERRKDMANERKLQSDTSDIYQKPILHMEPNKAQDEIDRIQKGIPPTKQRLFPSQPNVNRHVKQTFQTIDSKKIDLNSSSISSSSSSPRRSDGDEVDYALSKLIQQNSKLSRLQKKTSPTHPGTGLERMIQEPKSSRMFNINRERHNHEDSFCDDQSTSSDFSIGPNDKRIRTGLPQFSITPYRGDDSHLDDSVELVYKR